MLIIKIDKVYLYQRYAATCRWTIIFYSKLGIFAICSSLKLYFASKYRVSPQRSWWRGYILYVWTSLYTIARGNKCFVSISPDVLSEQADIISEFCTISSKSGLSSRDSLFCSQSFLEFSPPIDHTTVKAAAYTAVRTCLFIACFGHFIRLILTAIAQTNLDRNSVK